MKPTNILLTILFLSIAATGFAQEVDGDIKINRSSEKKIEVESPYAVMLFKDFKTGKHKITFSFEADGFKAIESGDKSYPAPPIFGFFTFKTTVKHNGRTIGRIERKPMPYLPGDMLLPTEAFDFIHVLATYRQEGMAYGENNGAMPKGRYEIVLEAEPVDVDGRILRGIIMFDVK